MKKHLNKQSAKKLLVLGAILYAVSVILNFVTAYSIYGKDCVNKTASCTLSAEQIAGKIAMIVGYAGIGIFLVGLVAMLIVHSNQKQ